MQQNNDTIVAISTPPGIGGIAIIRMSGPESRDILARSFKGKTHPKNFKSHSIYFGKITNKKEVIDEVLVSAFIAPRSYTGEDVVEITCHGGSFVTHEILQQMLRGGARMAKKGEFTLRAFLNNKMDLTKAEAVIDLVNAKTHHSREASINQLQGKLYKSIKKILDKITDLRSELELDLDFSDQGIESHTTEYIVNKLQKTKRELKSLIKTADEGMILNTGYKVAITGKPNVGKSSLFNKIVENERAIVTNIPGTTRDYIEEDIALEGYLIKLFDTAGIQESKDILEKAGIERSFKITEEANLILWVSDITQTQPQSVRISRPEKDIIKVFNKIDLVDGREETDQDDTVFVSAITGAGIDLLKKKIVAKIDLKNYDIDKGMITNTRQLAAAKRSLCAITQAIKTAKQERGIEFIAFDLSDASEALEEIIGKVTSDKIINSIFERFCVGK
ncbi:MAG: tRNA uridine-5-carboxymethylaminomethyl(34) synthesis GTPase MnmE [Candidatus Cloacimonadia bacterium]